MKKQNKIDEVNEIIESGAVEEEQVLQAPKQRETRLVHTMRGVVVIIDVTKSMGMKDFKPSRLAAAVMAVRQFLRLLKQSTPLAVAALGLSSQGYCKIIAQLTYDAEDIIGKLDEIRIEQNPGCFSIESSLFEAIACLDQLPTSFHRQILVIQSSPMTKDQHSLLETIDTLRVSQVTLNVLTMCGWTQAIKKSVQTLKGKYMTVSSVEECIKQVKQFARPPLFNANAVKIELLKMGLVRKEQTKQQKRCFCHFKVMKIVYICSACQCTLCKQPPIECPMCGTILVMPTDLYNHTISA